MSERVGVDDLVQIKDLIARYNWATDTSDAEAFASLFTEDGRFMSSRFQLTGRDELAQFVRSEQIASRGLQHWTTNEIVTLESADSAAMRSYMLVVAPQNDGSITIELNGRYTDLLLRTPDGWKFFQRTFVRN